ncbi:MAG TPA: DUF4142 domain-containing protein [Chryseosolibacter sp.]|nr:DUF4142 domain-containing protein [Chryseosolibacter sp.]
MKRIFKILTVASLFAFYSCNETRREQDVDSNEVAEDVNEERFEEDNSMEKDADFVANAVASNLAEIQLAKLASERSSSPEVKKLAQMLEEEHTKTLTELKALASAKSISVPVEPEDEAVRKMENLREEKAEDFDKKWLDEVKDMHEKSIDKFEKRSEKSEDAEVKALASKTLPHLKMHKEKIEQCEEKIKDQNKNS